MLNRTSKSFCIFNKAPSASLVAHMTRDFLTCYSCSYHISMMWYMLKQPFLNVLVHRFSVNLKISVVTITDRNNYKMIIAQNVMKFK